MYFFLNKWVQSSVIRACVWRKMWSDHTLISKCDFHMPAMGPKNSIIGCNLATFLFGNERKRFCQKQYHWKLLLGYCKNFAPQFSYMNFKPRSNLQPPSRAGLATHWSLKARQIITTSINDCENRHSVSLQHFHFQMTCNTGNENIMWCMRIVFCFTTISSMLVGFIIQKNKLKDVVNPPEGLTTIKYALIELISRLAINCWCYRTVEHNDRFLINLFQEFNEQIPEYTVSGNNKEIWNPIEQILKGFRNWTMPKRELKKGENMF